MADTCYYATHREHETPMVLVLISGDVLRGAVKWYDRFALKIVRPDGPEIMVLKQTIKYVHEDDSESQHEIRRSP